jgi:hypothetical protein
MDDIGHVDEEEGDVLSSRQSNDDPNERNLRRAAERERLMRQMEAEESGVGGDHVKSDNRKSDVGDRWERGESKSASSFPPELPNMSGDENLTPFQILEKYERIIFDTIDQNTAKC